MTLSAGTLLGVLWWCAGSPDEQAVRGLIRKFQEDYHKPGARDDERISAVRALAENHHERVVKTLSPLLLEASAPVRMIVARSLAQFGGVEAASRELLGALQAPANAGAALAAVRIEILRALGALSYLPAAAEITRLIGDADVWVAKAAIDASGRVRSEGAIPALIKVLKRIEGHEGDLDTSDNPLGSLWEGMGLGPALLKPDPRHPKGPNQRELLKAPVLEALQAITKQSFGTARDWDHWWAKNRNGFRISH